MKFLVTGGAGFIGSHYVRGLLTAAWPGLGVDTVTVLDKLTYAGNLANLDPVSADPRLTFVQGDIVDRELVDGLMADADVVVNLAAESHVDRSIVDAAPFLATNVVGTQVLLDAAKRHGVDRFVHVSTDEVYGPIIEGSYDTDAPLRPTSPYAASKASADLLALSSVRTYGLPVSIVRCANNYGPYQFPEKVIPRFVTHLLDGKQVPLYGRGAQVRSWLHVDDHCRALHLIAGAGRTGAIYHVPGTQELSNLELTQCILDALELSDDRIDFVADRPGHDFRYALEGVATADELGYAPHHDFSSGLAQTIAWYQERRDWWDS